MDAGLSFIMANHGKVKENDIVFDPFVGTGIFILPMNYCRSVIYVNKSCANVSAKRFLGQNNVAIVIG